MRCCVPRLRPDSCHARDPAVGRRQQCPERRLASASSGQPPPLKHHLPAAARQQEAVSTFFLLAVHSLLSASSSSAPRMQEYNFEIQAAAAPSQRQLPWKAPRRAGRRTPPRPSPRARPSGRASARADRPAGSVASFPCRRSGSCRDCVPVPPRSANMLWNGCSCGRMFGNARRMPTAIANIRRTTWMTTLQRGAIRRSPHRLVRVDCLLVWRCCSGLGRQSPP